MAKSKKLPSPRTRANRLMYRVLEAKLEAALTRAQVVRRTGCSWCDSYDDPSVKIVEAEAHQIAQSAVDELTRLYQIEDSLAK